MRRRGLQILPPPLWWRGAQRPPRKWQAEALPHVLGAVKAGRNSLVSAVTGAGKSGLVAEVCAQVQPSPKGRVVVSTSTVQLVHQLTATIQGRMKATVGQRYAEARTDGQVIVTSNASMAALLDEMQQRGHHVELWLVDEAHGSQCETMLELGEALEGVPRVGFTATPYRAKSGERLELFDHLAFRYGLDRALSEGVVVPPRVELWRDQVADLDDACIEMIGQHMDLGPGVVNATNIEDAEDFADLLTESGIEATAVHSQMSAGELEGAIADLESGRLDCLVHVSLLSEGVDLPWLRWICLRRQVGSRVRFAQEIGRGLRSHPGKADLLVLDPLGLTGRLSLSYEAMLGAGQEEEGSATAMYRATPSRLGHSTAPPVVARPTNDLLASLRSLRLYLETRGVCEPRQPTTHKALVQQMDRSAKPEQLAAMEACRRRLEGVELPEKARRLLGWIYHHRQDLSQTAAADAVAVLKGLADSGWG